MEQAMNETITITREECDALRSATEGLADLRAFDSAQAGLAAGTDELVPADFARRLVEGENPVRVYRDLRGLTQMALFEISGVNRVQISDIEAGRKTGSVETLRKLADALRVTIDDLV
jgi:mRNA interferase RelE/StbE